jgi:Divergent InlB B-repeat domain
VTRLAVAVSAAALLAALALGAAGRAAGPDGRGTGELRFAPATRASRVPTRTTELASTWCGDVSATDRSAQVVPGPTVHLVYAYPADGVDRLAQFGSQMQTDAETIDAWWRGQDPSRTVRFDSFGFPCGAQLDISDVKLPVGGAELAPVDGRFERLLGLLSAAGFTSDYEIYVVYYDGPDSSGGICGIGGTADPSRGQAFAFVFPAGCPNEPTSVVAAHELVHALGAVRSPAPHECPAPDDGHVCDTRTDLMYPFADGSPLSSLQLDVGRDDYYGASGIGFDVRTSNWLRHLDEPQAHLAIAIAGSGSVTSDLPGVVCTVSCASDWDGGESPTLSAAPAAGMRFVRWGGACSGSVACRPAMAPATNVTALFAPRTYQVTVGILGRGNVLTSAVPHRCQRRCRLDVTSYQALSLRAVAAAGWRFTRWTGTCRGARPTCRLPMTSSAAATAVFAKRVKKK